MDSKRTRTVTAVAMVLLIVGGVAWAFWDWVDPEVAALESERRRVFSGEATDADRDAFRQRVGQLDPSQRRELFERGRPDMQRRMSQRMTELFSLPREQLRAEARNRAAAVVAARAERDANGDQGGPPFGPPGIGRGGPGGDPASGGGQMTDAQRDARRKQRLDFADPATRAQFSEFRLMINEELESRGHEPLSGRDMRSLMRGMRES
ncbi:MAG: hypothetical protein AAGJ46_14715 [Planctomycetota bacterium]